MPNPGDPRIEQPRNPLELHITIGVPFQYPMFTDRDGRDVYLDEMAQSPGNLSLHTSDTGDATVTLANPIVGMFGSHSLVADARAVAGTSTSSATDSASAAPVPDWPGARHARAGLGGSSTKVRPAGDYCDPASTAPQAPSPSDWQADSDRDRHGHGHGDSADSDPC